MATPSGNDPHFCAHAVPAEQTLIRASSCRFASLDSDSRISVSASDRRRASASAELPLFSYLDNSVWWPRMILRTVARDA